MNMSENKQLYEIRNLTDAELGTLERYVTKERYMKGEHNSADFPLLDKLLGKLRRAKSQDEDEETVLINKYSNLESLVPGIYAIDEKGTHEKDRRFLSDLQEYLEGQREHRNDVLHKLLPFCNHPVVQDVYVELEEYFYNIDHVLHDLKSLNEEAESNERTD